MKETGRRGKILRAFSPFAPEKLRTFLMFKYLLSILIIILIGCSYSIDNEKLKDETSNDNGEDSKIVEPTEQLLQQDFVYYVDSHSESLAEIVQRFTLDAANTDTVARINEIDKNSFLKRGQLIRIPNYMLKRNNLTQ
jgi:hypothetical protein